MITSDERNLVDTIRGPSRREREKHASAALAQFGGTYARLSHRVNRFRRRVVHLIRFPQYRDGDRRRLGLGVRFAQSLSNHEGRAKTLLTFEDLLAAEPHVLFGFNFLYFITRNLLEYFNQSNPHFTLAPWFFGQAIDLLKARVADDNVLHPPLYHKGAVGMMPDGSFVFGRVRLPDRGSVTVPVGRAGRSRRLEWTHVNPSTLAPESGVSVFTPMAEHCRDSHSLAAHVGGETRGMFFIPVNINMYNFVMINDRLLGVVRGRTEIPPFGTVLSAPAGCFDDDERSLLDAEAIETGREDARCLADGQRRVAWDFTLDARWAGAEWIMGGALLMVDDGRTGELDPAGGIRERSIYRLEGWDLESSQRTQETPVETNLREARTTIGLTTDGQFFLSLIEGRANNRLGATHLETMDCLQTYFQACGTEVRYALDLDSASSVALGIATGGRFWLLNQTARGSDSKLGDTRFFNHLAFLAQRPFESTT